MKFNIKPIMNKKYRVVWIGAAIILILIIVIPRLGSRSAAQNQIVQSGPSENLQLAAMQIGAQNTQIAAGLQAANIQAQSDATIATLSFQRDLSLAGIASADNVNTLTSQLQSMEMQLGFQRDLASIEGQVRMAETEAFRDVSLEATRANVDMFALGTMAGLERDLAFIDQMNTQALVNRDVEIRRIDAQENIALDQGTTERFGISSANKQARGARRTNLIGAAIGTIGRILTFSDMRIKQRIRQTGETPDGYPWYEYKIAGQWQAGVMAQDMLSLKPEVVSPHWSGLLMVDYDRVSNG